MKIIYLVLVFVFTFPCESNSQITFGIKGNYSLSFSKSQQIKWDDELDFLLYQIRYIEQDISPYVSGFVRFNNNLVFVQSELAYRRVKTRFSSIYFLDYDDLNPKEQTKTTHSLILPFSAGIKIQNFRFGAGPVARFTIKENEIFTMITEFEERRRKLNMAFQILLSIDLARLQVDLSFEQQFNGVGESFYFRQDNKGFQGQTQLLNLGLGYRFN